MNPYAVTEPKTMQPKSFSQQLAIYAMLAASAAPTPFWRSARYGMRTKTKAARVLKRRERNRTARKSRQRNRKF